MMSKNDALYLLVEDINTKLDRIINLLTVLTDTMNEDVYIRTRSTSSEVYQFDPKEYNE